MRISAALLAPAALMTLAACGDKKDTEPAADGKASADRFSVSRHGLLVALGAAD